MSDPSVRGWHQHPGDPAGVQRWWDGTTWAPRTTAGPSPVPGAAPRDLPLPRGWHVRPGDPEGVQRWCDGRAWTTRLTGGTPAAQAEAARLSVEDAPAAIPVASPPSGWPGGAARVVEPQWVFGLPQSALLDVPPAGEVAVWGDADACVAIDSRGRPVALAGETPRGRWALGTRADVELLAASLGGTWFSGQDVLQGHLAVGEFEALLLDDGLRATIPPRQGTTRVKSGGTERLAAGQAFGCWIPWSDATLLTGARGFFALEGAGFLLVVREVLPLADDGRTVGWSSRAGELARQVLRLVTDDRRRSADADLRALGAELAGDHVLQRFESRSRFQIALARGV